MAVKNILKYIRSSKNLFLIYGDGDLIVSRYTDASFQSNRDDFKSQLGYAFTLNGGIDSWKSSKQKMIVDSTTELEYIVAFDGSYGSGLDKVVHL